MSGELNGLRVAFDCDGVILDSNPMKCDAFRDTVASYPAEATEPFLAYQRTAFGTSRYRLFDMFFADYLGREPEPGERDGLLEAFGRKCRQAYGVQPFTLGALETLSDLAARGVRLSVVSGSDQDELREMFEGRGLTGLFVDGIYGSPTSKADNLATVAAMTAGPLVFVGDAEADVKAARVVGARFIGMATWSADPDGLMAMQADQPFETIGDLTDLPALLASDAAA